MTIRRRLAWAFAAVLGLFALNLALYLWSTAQRTAALERVGISVERQMLTARLTHELSDLRRMIELATESADGNAALPPATLDNYRTRSRRINQTLERILERSPPGAPFSALPPAIGELLAAQGTLLRAHGVDPTTAVTEQVRAESLALTAERQLRDIEQRELELAAGARADSYAVARLTNGLTLFLFLGSGVLAIALYFGLSRHLSRGLAALGEGAERFGSGNLEHRIAVADADELAVLAQGFNDMAQNLARARSEITQANFENVQRAIEVDRHRKALEEKTRELQALTRSDPLTGIPNRRAFDERLAQEWQRSVRSQRPLSLLVVDVDWFKPYNDSLGHPAGDACLRAVAQAMSECLRNEVDFLARYGGEEFAALLPEAGTADAKLIGERLRQAVLELRLPHPAAPSGEFVTVSVGHSTVTPRRGETTDALVAQADAALYQAKREGRDRVVEYTAEAA